jgi:hypothetical protein
MLAENYNLAPPGELKPHIHPEEIPSLRAISEQFCTNEDVSLPFSTNASPPIMRMVKRGGNSFLIRILNRSDKNILRFRVFLRA